MPDEGEAFAAARRAAFPAMERLGSLLLEDVGVPVPSLPTLVHGIRAIAAARDTHIVVVAHAGDGNTHPIIAYPAGDAAAEARARLAFGEVMDLALSLGGTITGEHGVGRLKEPWLGAQLGPDVMALTRRIKDALDPVGILNPGVVLADPAHFVRVTTTATLLVLAAAWRVGDWLAVALPVLPAGVRAQAGDAGAARRRGGGGRPGRRQALGGGRAGSRAAGRRRADAAARGRTDRPFLARAGRVPGRPPLLPGRLRRSPALHGLQSIAGLLIVGGAAALVLPDVLRGARQLRRASSSPTSSAAYAAVLASMAVLAVGTSIIATAIGGVLFLVSDMLIARDRFVAPVRHGKLLVIVTYHLAQFLILIGLIGSL